MNYVAISNKEALDWEYRVEVAEDGKWLMNAPLQTVRMVFGLHNLAVNRIIAAEFSAVDLHQEERGIGVGTVRVTRIGTGKE